MVRAAVGGASGAALRNPNWRRDVFDSAIEALGLKITPHNVRDTAASLAIQEGASVVAVVRLLGHESAATTLNHYAGLFPTDLDDIASLLNAAAIDYGQPTCVIRCQTITDQSTDPNGQDH